MSHVKTTYLFICLNIVIHAQTNTSLSFYQNKLKEYRYSKYLDSSHYYFKKALPIAISKKDSVTLFDLYKYLGDAYEHHQHIDSTLMMYDSCAKYTPVHNLKLKSFLLHDRSYTYQLLYDYDKSTQLTMQALKIAEQSKDNRQVASVSISVADGFSNLKMSRQAEYYYLYAITFAQFAQDTFLLSQAHRNYGVHLLNEKNYDDAFLNLNEANKFSVALNDSISMAYVWHHLATYYWQKKETDLALELAKKAERVWERRAEYIDLRSVCLQQGTFYLELSNYKQATFYLKKAEKYVKSDLYFNSDLYTQFATLYNKTNNKELAYNYLLQAKTLNEKIKEKENKAKVMSLRIKFEADQKETIIQQQKEKSKLLSVDAKNKTFQRNSIALLLLLSALLLILIAFAYYKIKRKNDLLRQSNNDLDSLASQKQLLLKEIHHRVKNNLTNLSSINKQLLLNKLSK